MRTVTRVSRLLQRSCQISCALRVNIKSFSTNFTTRECKEIQISVPWGHISGKWYGPRDKRPIVGLHGWQDNAGTFDTLAPLLPSNHSFLSIDLPGHGKSSWYPDGCIYHSLDYVKTILILMREFKWEKISMICHSMSAVTGFVFNSFYPDKCDMFISLDVVKPFLQPKEKAIDVLAGQILESNKYDEIIRKKTKPPCYTYDELVNRLHTATKKSISKEHCHFILNRNIKPSDEDPSKYYFSRDSRLKAAVFYSFPHEVVVEMVHRIACPHLVIKAAKSLEIDLRPDQVEILNMLQKKPSFEYHQVISTHHMHLMDPEKIADIVNPFINKYKPM